MPIEQHAPEFARLIAADAEIARHTPDDYGGDNGPAEGPVWWSDGGYLLFSDIHNNRRIKFVPGQGASVDHEPTNRSNGLTRDLQGRLIACEHDSRRVTRTDPDGSITVVAASFQGRRLNRPNDVVVKSDGCIYFTDPWTLPTPPEQWDLPYSGVYRVTPDLGSITLLVDDFVTPNGLAFSPDESILYVNDSRRGHIRSFEVNPNGSLARQTDRGVRRPDRRRAGRPRRHEGGRRGQHLLRRLRRPVGCWTRRARSWAWWYTARRPPPTCASAVPTGRRSTSPAATISARCKPTSPASPCLQSSAHLSEPGFL